MTRRIPLDAMTSDALDALYDRIAHIRGAAALHRQGLLSEAELHAVIEAEPAETEATAPAWTPPPPGDTREQLPDTLLDLIRGSIPDYVSTACVTADTLAVAVHWSHPQRAELGQWAERLHQRCRRNQKFTGQLCVCGCHA